MKRILAPLFVVVMLVGCGGSSWEQKVTAAEASYTATLQVLVAARKPCIENENNDCLINDEVYLKIDPIVQNTDIALNFAKAQADSGNVQAAEDWLNKAITNISGLQSFAGGAIELEDIKGGSS